MKKKTNHLQRIFNKTSVWAAISLTLISNAQAFTFSSPFISSKQGEVLKAEIEILNATDAELQDLKASIGSADLYKAANIEIPRSGGEPLDINIQLIPSENKRIYLKISSTQIVNSNFLDLLIDMKWTTGRVIRDLSLSIDQTPKQALIEATLPPIGITEANAEAITVQNGDTASELAMRYIQKEVSLDQMLVALIKGNPDAFINENVNLLRSGAQLTMPSTESSLKTSVAEAHQKIRFHAESFKAYRSELASRVPGGHLPKASRDSSGHLEAFSTNKNKQPNKDTLTLSKPSTKNNELTIAMEHEARELVKHAAEINRNISELSKISSAAVASSSAAGISGPSASNPSETDKLTPASTNIAIGIAMLIAVLTSIKLLFRRKKQRPTTNTEPI